MFLCFRSRRRAVSRRAAAGAERLTLRLTATTVFASPPFGRNDSRFAPVLLANWEEPIQWWQDGAELTTNAASRAESRATNATHFALEVPGGTRVAYLQIANTEQAEGTYDQLRVELVTAQSAAPSEPLALGRNPSCAVAKPGGRYGFPPWREAIMLSALLAFRALRNIQRRCPRSRCAQPCRSSRG